MGGGGQQCAVCHVPLLVRREFTSRTVMQAAGLKTEFRVLKRQLLSATEDNVKYFFPKSSFNTGLGWEMLQAVPHSKVKQGKKARVHRGTVGVL